MKLFLLMLAFFSLLACKRLTHLEKEIKGNLNKEVNLKMITNIQKKGVLVPFDSVRLKYKYIYLVYLKNDCSPCYTTYVKWQNEMLSLNKPDNFTILFIIRGESYDDFINETKKDGLKEDRFYTFMDLHDTFLEGNNTISLNIIRNIQ